MKVRSLSAAFVLGFCFLMLLSGGASAQCNGTCPAPAAAVTATYAAPAVQAFAVPSVPLAVVQAQAVVQYVQPVVQHQVVEKLVIQKQVVEKVQKLAADKPQKQVTRSRSVTRSR